MSYIGLPRNFRRLNLWQRREEIEKLSGIKKEDFRSTIPPEDLDELIDISIESAVGSIPVPLGVASGLIIDGELIHIPMAIEEPSVIAAATYGGRTIAKSGGFRTKPAQPVMAVQMFLEYAGDDAERIVLANTETIKSKVNQQFPKMAQRGGGYLELTTERLKETRLLKITIFIDVRDAFGANLLNTAGEALAPFLEELTGGKSFMNILTNSANRRVGKASFAIPVDNLARAGLSGILVAERIELASQLAAEDPERAVTNNKGIMNGVTALALATGNDTRALESAVHMYAAKSGTYQSLTKFYRDQKGQLVGEIEIPTPLGIFGGNISFNPASRFSLGLLGNPDAQKLSSIAASLGLAQNFAAIWALVSEGIQHGHMHLHGKRLAYQAGARGNDIEILAARLSGSGKIDLANAQLLLKEMKRI